MVERHSQIEPFNLDQKSKLRNLPGQEGGLAPALFLSYLNKNHRHPGKLLQVQNVRDKQSAGIEGP
jgi:hypothetical protein